MAEVITLNISDDFAKKIKDADENIKKLVKTSEDAKNSIIQHFKEMGDMGVGYFIQKINEAKQSINGLGTIQINSNGTSKAIDDINLLIQAISKLSESQIKTLSDKQSKTIFKQMLNEAKELQVIVDENGRKLTRQNKQNIADNKIANEQLKTSTLEAIANEKAKRVEIQRTLNELKRLAKAYKSMPTSLDSSGVGKILKQSSSATSINQHLTAISNLKNAIKDLDVSQKDYQSNLNKLNSEIARHKAELEKLGVNTDDVRKKQSNLMDTTGQLKRQLALLFSVSAIQGYMDKLINVRKEFELQQRSLQVLLQSKDQADKLWNQTLDLAVKSPFRVKELVSYTKQLAAYRIETDKLHDTTKRLADVSAGLGVDMQRLILAFGQVRAANFLRGTELRQFTEAGIPMLDELAKYFTELEGRMVSAGDVFERISKRMVSFSDVEEVFRRMTDAGGVFFNMQEEQSKTLAGMISNLHDSIDLMFNEIGASYDDLLKGSVNFAKFFVEHWELMGSAIKGVVLALSSYKLYQLAAKDAMIQTAVAQGVLNSQGVKQLSLIQLLKVGWNNLALSINKAGASFKAFMAFNIPLMAITAAISAIWELTSAAIEHEKVLKDITKQYDELRKKSESINVKFNIATQDKDIKTQKAKLKELVDLANNDYNLNIKVNVEGMSYEQVQNKFTEISKQIFDANIFSEHFAKQMQKATEWVVEDDIFEDFNQLGEEANKTLSNLALNRERVIFNLQKQQDSLNDSQKQALKFLEQPKKIDESEVEYLERLRSGYSILIEEYVQYKDKFHKAATLTERSGMYENLLKMQKTLSEMGIDANKISSGFFDFDQSIQEAQREFLEFANTINLDKNLSPEQKEIRLRAAIDKLASEKNWNDFVKNYIGQWTKEPFGVTISFTPKKETKELEDWQKRVNKAVGDLNQRMKEAIPDLPDNMLFPLTQAGDKLNEYLNTAKSRLDEINTTFTGGQQIYDQWTVGLLNAQKEFAPIYQDIINLHKKTKSGAGKDWFSEVVSGIQDAHKEYIKLNKTLDATESKQLTLKKYSELFSDAVKNAKLGDISLGDLNFETEQGVIDALTMLKDKLPKDAKDAHFKIEQALSDIVGEVRVKTKIESDKELVDSIEEMFGNYEVSLELEKLNIPPDLAKQLFNIDSLTLPDLKNKLIELKPKFEGKEMLEEWDKLMKKLNDKEEKEQEERLKKYTKYLLKAQSERVRIKLEEMRQLAEIDKEDKYSQDQKETIKRSLRIETQEKLDKEAWDEFKNSEMYTQMFEDLENLGNKAIDNLLGNLEKLKDSLKNLPANEVKEIMTQINKLSDIKNERNPFASLRDAMKEVRALEAQGKTEETLQLELQAADARAKSAQNDIDAIDTILNAKREGLSLDSQSVEWQNKYGRYVGLTVEMLEEQKRELGEIVDHNKNISEQSNKGLSSYAKARNALRAVNSEWESIRNMASKAYDSIKTILESMGVEADSTAMVLADMGMSLVDLVFQAISFGVQLQIMTVQAELLGVAINSALGPIGWAVLALQGIATVFSGILGLGDAKKERKIKKEQELVENLEKAYKKLEKAIENAYSISGLESNNAKAQQNIQSQIKAYERMIALEEDKKNTDKDKIKDWKNTIDELREQAKELNKDVASTATAGIMDSVLSASQEFTNAWLEAFNETGDGLRGLENNFKETMLEMVKQQASMLITQSYVEKWKNNLANYINADDLELTTNEAKKWVDSVTTSLPMLNDALENYFTAMKQAGVELNETGELSGLQRGIQGVSESTAQIIEAYLNSVRFYVADSNTKLTQLVNQVVGGENTPNPMLSELKTQTEMIRAIRDMFSSVIRNGHPTFGGAFIKVAL